MLSKWYPYSQDPQFGVFIRKQAIAISLFREIVVYSSHAHSNPESPSFELKLETFNKLTEYRMFYRKNTSFLSPLINSIRYLQAWSKARKEIWKNHGTPSIIHAYILLRPAILAFFTSRIYRIPYVVSEQWSGYTTGKFLQRPFLVRSLSKFVFRKAKARIVVSEFLRSSMEQLGFHQPIEVIPNVIEIQNPKERKPSGKIQVLVVADLVDEIKNISGLLNAFAKAKSEIPNIFLQIIGHGKDEKLLKKMSEELGLLPDAMQFEGLKNNQEVYEALWNSDFLIMNSRYETFSLICAEAFSCGKPVIATRCGGPEEFVNESNGILVPVEDQDKLYQAIIRMSNSYKNYSSENIRKNALEKFGANSVGSRFDLLYKRLI